MDLCCAHVIFTGVLPQTLCVVHTARSIGIYKCSYNKSFSELLLQREEHGRVA